MDEARMAWLRARFAALKLSASEVILVLLGLDPEDADKPLEAIIDAAMEAERKEAQP